MPARSLGLRHAVVFHVKHARLGWVPCDVRNLGRGQPHLKWFVVQPFKYASRMFTVEFGFEVIEAQQWKLANPIPQPARLGQQIGKGYRLRLTT